MIPTALGVFEGNRIHGHRRGNQVHMSVVLALMIDCNKKTEKVRDNPLPMVTKRKKQAWRVSGLLLNRVEGCVAKQGREKEDVVSGLSGETCRQEIFFLELLRHGADCLSVGWM